MLNWIISNGTVFDIGTVLTLNWIFNIQLFWHLTVCKKKSAHMLNWISWIRTVWLNWIAWNRNIFDELNCVLVLNWIVWNRTDYLYIYIYIYILWRGMLPRGKGRSIPLHYGVWINRPQGLTAKTVGEWRSKATCTPWPIEEKKPNDWPDPLSPKWLPFRQRKLGKESLVWWQKLANRDTGLQPKLREVPSPARRIFTSGQTLAKERRLVRQLRGCHPPVKERNLKIKPWQR